MSKGNKANKVDRLFNELDGSLDFAEFAAIERRDPMLASKLAELIGAGVSAQDVAYHVMRGRPHRWVEAQAIYAACRYLEGEG